MIGPTSARWPTPSMVSFSELSHRSAIQPLLSHCVAQLFLSHCSSPPLRQCCRLCCYCEYLYVCILPSITMSWCLPTGCVILVQGVSWQVQQLHPTRQLSSFQCLEDQAGPCRLTVLYLQQLSRFNHCDRSPAPNTSTVTQLHVTVHFSSPSWRHS